MARISYTEKEVELLARLIKSEALGEGEEGMLLVGNVVVNRVVANCDIFRNVRTLSEVIYQTNQFAGVGQPLFNEPVNQSEKAIIDDNVVVKAGTVINSEAKEVELVSDNSR